MSHSKNENIFKTKQPLTNKKNDEVEEEIIKQYVQQRETKHKTEPTKLYAKKRTRNHEMTTIKTNVSKRWYKKPKDTEMTYLQTIRQIYRPDLVGDLKEKVPNLKLNSKYLNVRSFLENKLKLKKVEHAFDANTRI